MLHRKRTIKEKSLLGKKDSTKLRGSIVSALGDGHSGSLDSFWKKNDNVTRVTWEFSSGDCVFVVFVNDIPLMISRPFVGKYPSSTKGLLMCPTVFFFLMMRNYYKGDEINIASLFGPSVFCRGPTSQFIISGAHLMMPGIGKVVLPNGETLQEGQLVLVHSLGNAWPYAIGLSTDNLVQYSKQGRGVEILHSFKDLMWEEYFTSFNANCRNVNQALPIYFCENEVCESIPPESSMVDANMDENIHDKEERVDGNETDSQNGNPVSEEEELLKATWEILGSIDGCVDFAFCETLKSLKQSSLPMPLTEFTSIFLTNYPRFPGKDTRIDMKNTPYKKVLPYLLSRKESITVTEQKPGVHSVVNFSKSNDLFRRHVRVYSDFLQWFHEPEKERERLEAEQQSLQDGAKGVFKQRITLVEKLLSLQNKGTPELRKILAIGVCNDNQISHDTSLDEDENLRSELYTQKQVSDNLRNYISAKGLLEKSGEVKGPPFVRLEGCLSYFSQNDVRCISITELEDVVVGKFFNTVWEITMETTQTINGVATNKAVINRSLKRGKLRLVSISMEKRAGNKVVTIVKGLDEYGFYLLLLINEWKRRFSTSCTLHEPAKVNQRLKNGAKIPPEIHLGGDWVSKLQVVLKNDLGIPQRLIVTS